MLMPGLPGAAPLAFGAEDYPGQRNSGLGFDGYFHLARACATPVLYVASTKPEDRLTCTFRIRR